MKIKKYNDVASIGFIGIPDEVTISRIEKECGKPIKMIKKNG